MAQFSFLKENRLEEISRRRAELIRRAESQRQSMMLLYHQLERPMHWVDYGISAGRLANKGSIVLPLALDLFLRLLPERLAVFKKMSKWPVRMMEVVGLFKQARSFFSYFRS